MASVASRVSKASRWARDDAQIIHEGWTEHFSINYKTWYRYWMILTDTDVELYSVITPSGKRQLSGKLHLGSTTEIVNSSGPTFGFELITSSTISQQKELFKFKNENDRDLWKAYIIGLTSGNVPADVNLLPGQLRDVRHAVHQVPAPALPPPTVRHRSQHVQDPSQRHVTPRRSSPELPPVPTSPPPPPPVTTTASTSADVGVDESRLPPVDYDADEDDEVRAYAIGDGRVSVRLCNGIAKVYESTADDDEMPVNGAPSSGLQQLMARQSNLAFKTLDDERQLKRGHMTSRFVGQWLPSSSSHLQRARSLSSGASGLQLGSASVRFFANERSWSDRLQPATTRVSSNNSSNSNNNNKNRNKINNETHPFYSDALKNSFPPSWFVECDRETAESVLLASRNHGNVLMRPSNLTGSYGITMRCDEPSGSRILHYAVHRTASGFRIAVENQQRPMPCLGDVMDFFVEVVGPSAVPLTAVVGRNLLVTTPGQSALSPSHSSAEQTGIDVAAPEVATAMVTPDGEGRNATSSTSVNGAKSWPMSVQTSSVVVSGSSSSTGFPGRQRVILNATVSSSRSPFAEPEPPPR